MHKLSIILVILFVALLILTFAATAYVLPKLLPFMAAPDAGRNIKGDLPKEIDAVSDARRDPVPPVRKRELALGENKEIKIISPNLEWFLDPALTIKGEARGTWFFEGDFPVRLEDADGTVLARGIAKAEGEWMTRDYVPFTVVLNYDPPATEGGKLIFEKDNPSGLPKNAAAIALGVKFRMTTKYAGEACATGADCSLPAEFAVRSVCPYEVKCLKEKCTVDCANNFD